MLQRFAARRRKWLKQDAEPSPVETTVLIKDEDATTQSSTRPESEAPDASSARSATDEMDISIGLIDVPEPEVRPPDPGPGGIGDETLLMARNLVEAQMLREQRLAGGDEDDTSEPEATELPLLQHLQDMARTFDALMAGVSSTRCVAPPSGAPVAPVAPAPDLITGSALHAARRLRQQGYAKPTISSTRRRSGHDCSHWTGPAMQADARDMRDARDVDHLLRIAYSPSRPGGTSRGREKTPWRLSNIEPEPWHVTWDKTR